ncbi:MAG: hypothetical protein KAR21_18560 [Spirochaetales bacterium]|nr:hypothetical protein [Spirochaetales bacterium]
MKKYLLLILIAVFIVSCYQDENLRDIENSFEQFLNSLEIENLQQAEKFVPFLADLDEEELSVILEPFRLLNGMDYDLEISKNSDNTYILRINTGDSESLWSGIFIPYQQDIEDRWVMAPIIKSVQFIDIIPAEN